MRRVREEVETEMSKTDRKEFIAEAMIAWMHGYMANPQKVIVEPEVGADDAYFIAVTFWDKFSKEELSGKQEDEEPRLFKVGDEVEFELLEDGLPRWNWDEDRLKVGQDLGRVVRGIVDEVREEYNTFVISSSSIRGPGYTSTWLWYQPTHPRARYGSPGYLRLVKPVDG
jgi:hypothetical protein